MLPGVTAHAQCFEATLGHYIPVFSMMKSAITEFQLAQLARPECASQYKVSSLTDVFHVLPAALV